MSQKPSTEGSLKLTLRREDRPMTVHEAPQSLSARASSNTRGTGCILLGQPSEKGWMPLVMKHGFLK